MKFPYAKICGTKNYFAYSCFSVYLVVSTFLLSPSSEDDFCPTVIALTLFILFHNGDPNKIKKGRFCILKFLKIFHSDNNCQSVTNLFDMILDIFKKISSNFCGQYDS